MESPTGHTRSGCSWASATLDALDEATEETELADCISLLLIEEVVTDELELAGALPPVELLPPHPLSKRLIAKQQLHK
jgi:hypothetical protein